MRCGSMLTYRWFETAKDHQLEEGDSILGVKSSPYQKMPVLERTCMTRISCLRKRDGTHK